MLRTLWWLMEAALPMAPLSVRIVLFGDVAGFKSISSVFRAPDTIWVPAQHRCQEAQTNSSRLLPPPLTLRRSQPRKFSLSMFTLNSFAMPLDDVVRHTSLDFNYTDRHSHRLEYPTRHNGLQNGLALRKPWTSRGAFIEQAVASSKQWLGFNSDCAITGDVLLRVHFVTLPKHRLATTSESLSEYDFSVLKY
ncbi:hypothetical protein B0H11DRAFT_1928864 [Mycena galericulata]|nr:hypothetical protein B0H11DRAFT_1928864 [Mycena galericulata]